MLTQNYFDDVVGANYRRPLKKSYTTSYHSMAMCRWGGAKLSNHASSSVTVSKEENCVSKCSADRECFSANYNTDSGNCDLITWAWGNGNDYTALSDFDDNAASSDIYFSTRECL